MDTIEARIKKIVTQNRDVEVFVRYHDGVCTMGIDWWPDATATNPRTGDRTEYRHVCPIGNDAMMDGGMTLILNRHVLDREGAAVDKARGI